jgi:hypothetical protein
VAGSLIGKVKMADKNLSRRRMSCWESMDDNARDERTIQEVSLDTSGVERGVSHGGKSRCEYGRCFHAIAEDARKQRGEGGGAYVTPLE